ncbi:MAG: DegT/DnrJ/EryC1/StrS family aminotransferase, partial [Planctomycetota bacterium]|nr:DegT/DnrJ/EryC1/StrS family aminotransferase [Planctomycetota bacterium]
MWRLAEDTLSQDEINALADWLRRGERLTQGELVRQFEQAWSTWLGCADSVFVGSGTTANFALMACAAERVERPTPRVGVSAVTWSTNVSPSLLMGHEVVVFDVDPQTLGMRADAVCAAIENDEIDILFVTHLLGLNALTPQVVETAAKHGVILLEDCCESHGVRMGAAKGGTFGLGSTFSFYYGHHMSTI